MWLDYYPSTKIYGDVISDGRIDRMSEWVSVLRARASLIQISAVSIGSVRIVVLDTLEQ